MLCRGQSLFPSVHSLVCLEVVVLSTGAPGKSEPPPGVALFGPPSACQEVLQAGHTPLHRINLLVNTHRIAGA